MDSFAAFHALSKRVSWKKLKR